MSDYTIAERDDAFDIMAEYPGYGEMRSYAEALGAEQIAFTWRTMPAGTGGRGSYGHRHKSQEEIYFVVSGRGHVQGQRRRLQGQRGDGGQARSPGPALRAQRRRRRHKAGAVLHANRRSGRRRAHARRLLARGLIRVLGAGRSVALALPALVPASMAEPARAPKMCGNRRDLTPGIPQRLQTVAFALLTVATVLIAGFAIVVTIMI